MEEIVEQAGAVTFKLVSNSFEILLIRSKKDPERWIFPKGHVEIGESAKTASERELLEEAGVVGSSISKLGNLEYSMNSRKYIVTYFVNRFISFKDSGESGREPTWFDYQHALNQLYYPEMKTLLRSATLVIGEYLN